MGQYPLQHTIRVSYYTVKGGVQCVVLPPEKVHSSKLMRGRK